MIAGLLGLCAPQPTAWLAGAAGLWLAAFYALRVQPALGAGLVPAHLQPYALAVVGAGALLAVWSAGAVLQALLLVLVPAFAALAHASLRLRNVSNKLVNLLTDARHTPMGWAIGRLERVAGGVLDGRFVVKAGK